LAPHITLYEITDGFFYDTGRDLTGYEDGTENPTDDAAADAAICTSDGLAGSSFVAVQQWQHDLDRFRHFGPDRRDNTIGRRISDNEEIDDAPELAHVKRTAQESFDPEAFVLRRSMPYADSTGEGLVFVAFGHSFVAFDMIMRQILGNNDGIADALFSFSVPLGTSYFWCPAMKNGEPDLSLIGG